MIKRQKSYRNWNPVKPSFFKDEEIANEIYHNGYKIISCLDSSSLIALRKLYEEEHDIKTEDGGMFYSLYSRDKNYRKRIHEKINTILKPILDEYFKDYKNVINTFIVKLPGKKSEFFVHQDSTGLDEFKHSALSLWIPLEDLKHDDGPLAVIEKTHWLFSPYRGISIPSPFRQINQILKQYLKPLYLNAGDILFFDNRLIHNSLKNNSNKSRLVILCGIFPEKATFRSCYQAAGENEPIEVYEHNENYMLEYPHFFYNCTDRPSSGEIVERINDHFPSVNAEEFETFCQANNIPKLQTIVSSETSAVNCEFIAEPDGQNRFEENVNPSFWSKLLGLFQLKH